MSKVMKEELRKAGFKVSEETKGGEKMGKKYSDQSRDGGKYRNPKSQDSKAQKQRDSEGFNESEARSKIERTFGKNFVCRILELEHEDFNSLIKDTKDYLTEVVKKVRGKPIRRWQQITPHQLRNIFSRVRPMDSYLELTLLRPKLAYALGRAQEKETKELIYLLDLLAEATDTNEKLANFQSFFESIIAYHKYYGGK